MADWTSVVLFEKDSPKDLILRGFGQAEILERTGVDVGYHGNKYNPGLRGIDRYLYKLAYVAANYTRPEILSALDAYARCVDKVSVLRQLGVSAGSSNALFALADFFRDLGYVSEFREADRQHRLSSMRAGTEVKYGTDNVFKLPEFQERAAETRVEKYGARYTLCTESALCKGARETFARHMSDEMFAGAVDAKRRSTVFSNYGVEHPMHSDAIQEKVRVTTQRKYGVAHYAQTDEFRRMQSEYMREHAADVRMKSVDTCMARYGVMCYTQTDAFRKAQSVRMLDPEHQARVIATKKANCTLNLSNPERALASFLFVLFGNDNVVSQYMDARYPFQCDFYIPSRDLFIELNASWTHGGHWYNPDYEPDVRQADDWAFKSAEKPFYGAALETWRTRDVAKREAARVAGLNYLVFWSSDAGLDEVRLWAAMGAPDARDWDREYSWLPDTPLVYDGAFPDDIITARNRTAAAKAACWREFYKCELMAWTDAYFARGGTIQSRLYANRYKYLGKLPAELTGREILRGLGVSGIVRGYSSFDSTAMRDVLAMYDIHSMYDPCAGWGERLLTAGYAGVEYFGVDINPALQPCYQALIAQYGLSDCRTVCADSSAFDATGLDHEMIFTCPPYGDREIYTEAGAENLAWTDFLVWWRQVLAHSVNAGTRVVAYQVDERHAADMDAVVVSLGWQPDKVLTAAKSLSHLSRRAGSTARKNTETIRTFLRI